jgi:hypothetical protein
MASTYTPIATQALSTSASSVTFNSIPSTYTDLVLVITAKNVSSASVRLDLTFNSDTSSNYSTTRMYGNGSTASSDRFSNATAIDIGFLPGSSGNGFGLVVCNIQNYSNTTTNKTCIYRWNSQAATSGNQYVTAGVGLWRNTSAITAIRLVFAGDTIDTGSTFTLYGIKAE